MTANGVFQLVLYVVVLTALAKPLGAYMARVYEGRPFGLDRVLGPVERLIYRLAGVRPDQEMDWKNYAIAMLLFNFAGLLRGLRAPAMAAPTPAESTGSRPRVAGFVVQHGGEFRHQYQLAGLRRRDHDELSHADAWRSPSRTSSRPLPAWQRSSPSSAGLCVARPRPSATSGWISSGRRSTSCCPSRRCWHLLLVSQGVVQTFGAYAKVNVVQQTSYDEPVTDPDGKPVLDEKGQPKTKKSHADRAGPGGGARGVADRHQAARDQRGRLLQRQLGPPVRERDALLELPGGAGDPVRSRRRSATPSA